MLTTCRRSCGRVVRERGMPAMWDFKSYKVTYRYPGESRSSYFYVQARNKREALRWLPHGSRGSASLDRRDYSRRYVKRRRARRRSARSNPVMKKSTLYILGGLGGAAILGTGLYFALRPSSAQMGGGGKTLPPGGGGGGGTPPPAPNPQAYGQPNQQNNQQLLNDVAAWVNAMKGLQLSSELINALYKSVQAIASQIGFLLPANPLPVW